MWKGSHAAIVASVLAAALCAAAMPVRAGSGEAAINGAPVTACEVVVPEGLRVSERGRGHLTDLCHAIDAELQAIGVATGVKVELVPEVLTEQVFRGFLRWRSDTGAGRGPSQEFGIVDAELSPRFYGSVARSLIALAGVPVSAGGEN